VQWARPPGFVSHLAIAELTCRGAARRVAHARRALSPVGALLSERKPHQTLCNGARLLGFVSHLAIAELTCKGAARRAAMYLTGAELPVMPLAAASGCLAARCSTSALRPRCQTLARGPANFSPLSRLASGLGSAWPWAAGVCASRPRRIRPIGL
jgi:hypothetical protein